MVKSHCDRYFRAPDFVSLFIVQINARVSIAGRVRILGVLLVIRVAFTAYLLFNPHMLVVNFANNEVAGSR
jgi:hypothetical protein